MIKPMLAYKYKEAKVDWDKPVYIQPKLDGVRCLFTKDGAFSRTGKQFMNVQHIEKMLKHFFLKAWSPKSFKMMFSFFRVSISYISLPEKNDVTATAVFLATFP